MATAPRRCSTLIPELTRPNMVCLLSRYGVGASVRKNWEPRTASATKLMDEENGSRGLPLVFGPEFAMAKMPAPVKRNSGWISSSLCKPSAPRRPRDRCQGYTQLLAVDARSSASGACRVAALDHKVLGALKSLCGSRHGGVRRADTYGDDTVEY